jgi:hypothetical protein
VTPVAVVVLGVFGQDARQAPFADNKHAVGALASYRTDPALSVAFARGACGGVLSTSIPAAVKGSVELSAAWRYHVTVYRWVQRFIPLLADAARFARLSPGDRWHVDATYVKVNEVWQYVYRAVGRHGQVIDVLVPAVLPTCAGHAEGQAHRGGHRRRAGLPPPSLTS